MEITKENSKKFVKAKNLCKIQHQGKATKYLFLKVCANRNGR